MRISSRCSLYRCGWRSPRFSRCCRAGFGLWRGFQTRPWSRFCESGVSMQGILTLSVCPPGLRVGIMRVFGPFCRDFLVPWEAIRVTRKNVLFGPVAKLQFGHPAIGSLTIPAHVANRLAGAAMGRWPETGPFPEEKHRDTMRRLLTQWVATTCIAALFFTLAPLAVAPSAARPTGRCRGAVSGDRLWLGYNRKIRARKELKATSGRSAI